MSGWGSGSPDARELIDRGLARPEGLVDVVEGRDDTGERFISVRLDRGWSFDVLPDRGLDVGAAWWAGRPVAWRSPIVRDPGPGRAWERRFLGGLILTCGPAAIGEGPDGTLHGTHSSTPAHEVAVTRLSDREGPGVSISGVIDDVRFFGRYVRIRRVITARAGSSRLELRDRVENCGLEAEPLALLYHVNFGSPAVLPGTRVVTRASDVVPREVTTSVPVSSPLPDPIGRTEETVFEHRYPPAEDGVAEAQVVSPDGVAFGLRWSASSLPRLYQWVLPTRGGWALGLEPANAPLFGPERAGEDLGARLLSPGGTSELWVCVEAPPP